MGNMRLASFLVDLAIDDAFRDKFDEDPKGTLDSLKKPLSANARAAVLAGDGPEIFDILGVNNQNNAVARRRAARRQKK